MSFSHQRTTLLTCAVAGIALLTFAASPAAAAESPADEYCWQNADDGTTQCFADAAALDAAIASDTAWARGALLTTFTLATWYEDAGYLGSFTKTTSTNSAACIGAGQVNLNFTPAWNNRVSSFKTWYGCSGTLFSGSGQSGSSFGPFSSASSVAGMNDAGSSYRLG